MAEASVQAVINDSQRLCKAIRKRGRLSPNEAALVSRILDWEPPHVMSAMHAEVWSTMLGLLSVHWGRNDAASACRAIDYCFRERWNKQSNDPLNAHLVDAGLPARIVSLFEPHNVHSWGQLVAMRTELVEEIIAEFDDQSLYKELVRQVRAQGVSIANRRHKSNGFKLNGGS